MAFRSSFYPDEGFIFDVKITQHNDKIRTAVFFENSGSYFEKMVLPANKNWPKPLFLLGRKTESTRWHSRYF